MAQESLRGVEQRRVRAPGLVQLALGDSRRCLRFVLLLQNLYEMISNETTQNYLIKIKLNFN